MANLNVLFPLLPFNAFTTGTPVIPKFYWDVYSQEQRVKYICENLHKLIAYSDTLAEAINELNTEFENVEQNIQEQFKIIQAELEAELNEFKGYVEELIAQLSIQAPMWDVTHGKFDTSVEATRNMFNDLSDNALTIDEFNDTNVTVAQLADSGLNVRGWAVVNKKINNVGELDNYYKYVPSALEV